jgi:hypothetical protein
MKTAEIRASKFDSSHMEFHFLQVNLSQFEIYTSTSAVALEQCYELTGSLAVLSGFEEFFTA